MRNALWIALIALSMTMTVACNSKKANVEDDSSTVDCPAGTVFHLGYCVTPDGQIIQTGAVAYQARTMSNHQYTMGTVNITNWSVYSQLLREGFGICDQGSYNGGMAACTNFTNFAVSIQATNPEASHVRVTLEAYPNYNMGGYNYWISTPSWNQAGTCLLTSFLMGGCYMPMNQYQNQWYHSNVVPLTMSHSITNQNQGFELRSYGPTGTISQNKLIQLIVLNGSLKSGSFEFHLAYNGKNGGVFAQGTMVRCTTPSCGLLY